MNAMEGWIDGVDLQPGKHQLQEVEAIDPRIKSQLDECFHS
jgi:hypothetical protein